jgi:hypothetical protein
MKSAAWPDAEPPIDRVVPVPRLTEGLDNLFTYFSATDTQTGADRGNQVLGVRPELARHGADSGRCRTLNCSAPSGVHRADHAPLSIRNEDWRAIRHSNRDDEVRIGGDDRIRFRRMPCVAAGRDGHIRPVDLPDQANRRRIGPEGARD